MADDLKLSAQDIYEKEFHVEDNGYSPSEVDTLLDQVIEDYQTYDEKIRELGRALLKYEETMKELEAANAALVQQLEEQKTAAVEKNGAAAEEVPEEPANPEPQAEPAESEEKRRARLEDELVRRVERLEQAVFAPKVTE